MFHSALETLEYPEVIRLIQLEAKSEPGKAALARRTPQTTLAACEELQSELAEMVRYYHEEGLLPLAGLADTAAIFHGSEFGLDEAWRVVRAVRATQAIREALLRARDPFPRLQKHANGIADLSVLLKSVGNYFTREGKLREEASATLRSIRQKVYAKRAAIQRTLGDLMNRHTESVQEQIVTIRADRYVIPLRAERRNDIPGILHERSGSGASFFVEPITIVESNNDLAQLLIEEREEIARIVRDIARQLFEKHDEINISVERSGELDAIQACAVFYELSDATRPAFSESRELKLIEARHPLLDERLASAREAALGERGSEKVVPTTITLGPDALTLVISGPNAGGKTVARKTAGLIIAMAASGLPVPANDGTIIPVVDALHVTIGDDQSLLESLSTFSAYLVRLKRVLEGATARSLVLLDELGSGTDPEEGSALAAAVIEHLNRVGAMLIVTTHLTALKSFAIEDVRVLNASMEFDAETGRPTFRLVEGLPGRSRAIEAARHVGIPAHIIASARERLGSDYGKLDQLVADLQKRLSESTAELESLRRERAALERDRAAMESERERYESERKKLSDRYRDEADRLRNDVNSRMQKELRNLREIDRAAREKLNPKEVIERVTSAIPDLTPESAGKVEVGQEVEHRRFKIVGKVKSIDGKRAQILANGKTMQVEIDDLVPRAKAAPPQQQKKSRSSEPAAAAKEDVPIGAELNLVGFRVEDALDESDKFLDRALMNGTPAVRLIHGFGTGVLRKAVREYLRKHRGVRSWRPGDDHEGGDGATIALLDV